MSRRERSAPTRTPVRRKTARRNTGPGEGGAPGGSVRCSPTESFSPRCARIGPILMRDLGLTEFQAAGLLGNLGHETGGFRHLQEIAPAIPGSRGGWGIAQWTGPRRVAMEAWAEARGLDPASEAANLGFLHAELTTSEAGALAALKRAATLEEATEVFCRRFERPGIVALPDRLAWARRALTAIRRATGPTSCTLPKPAIRRAVKPRVTPARRSR